jgi:O-antigen ligase
MAYLKELHPWGPGESHNGYIEVFITSGIIGTILFGIVVITAIKGTFQQSTLHFDYGLFRLIFLIIVLVHNYSEAGFFRPTHLMWFLFLLMAVNVSYVQHRTPETRIASSQAKIRHKNIINNSRIHKLWDTR